MSAICRTCFNPRPRAGSDLSALPTRRFHPPFLPPEATRLRGPQAVSIHAPAREATPHDIGLLDPVSRCFNPRPRAGSDSAAAACRHGGAVVSIHAPAREATLRRDRPLRAAVPVSIHAPAREATSNDVLIMIEFRFNPRPRAGSDGGRHRGDRHRFNPRPRAGSDVQRRLQRRHPVQFQSTPPRGKRLSADGRHPRAIHAPAREATLDAWIDRLPPVCFNPRPRAGSDFIGVLSIHAPAREATCHVRRRRCFNPRPRAGSDVMAPGAATMVHVSIHAPAREATVGSGQRSAVRAVSIHAPAREATWPRCRPRSPLAVSIHAPAREATRSAASTAPGKSFNPRPRAGSDRRHGAARPQDSVSIHAPAREATCRAMDSTRTTSFNPRPRAGSDLIDDEDSGTDCFNPRPRAGSDGHFGTGTSTIPLFQSTPPRGKRPDRVGQLDRRQVSIHAPAREATRSSGNLPRIEHRRFNPRPRAGSDMPASGSCTVLMLFQSTPPRGKRPLSREDTQQNPFQSTPPRGKRRSDATVRFSGSLAFQSTPPRGKRPVAARASPQHGFNPRPRAGSDPTDLRSSECFNPRPRAGSDPVDHPRGMSRSWCFNPRPRAGSDLKGPTDHARRMRVSIHAPAREATCRPASPV